MRVGAMTLWAADRVIHHRTIGLGGMIARQVGAGDAVSVPAVPAPAEIASLAEAGEPFNVIRVGACTARAP